MPRRLDQTILPIFDETPRLIYEMLITRLVADCEIDLIFC